MHQASCVGFEVPLPMIVPPVPMTVLSMFVDH